MAISFQGSVATTDWTSATQSPVITAPASIQDGELLIMCLVTNTTTTMASSSAGWTLILDQAAGTDAEMGLYYKVASGEGANWTMTNVFNSTEVGRAIVMRYSGVDTTTPIHKQASNTGTLTSLAGPSITPTVSGCMILQFGGTDPSTSAYAATPDTSPTGTERFDGKDANSNAYICCQQYLQTAAAAIALDYTGLTSDSYAYAQIALNPSVTPFNASGGGIGGGDATEVTVRGLQAVGDGGAICGGDALEIVTYIIRASGGPVAGGEATVQAVQPQTRIETGSGGCIAGGTCEQARTVAIVNIVSDNFNRGDGPLGSNWIDIGGVGGSAAIASNEVVANGMRMYVWNGTFSQSQFAQHRLTANVTSEDFGVMVRCPGSGLTGYYFYQKYSSFPFELGYFSDGAWHLLSSQTGGTFSAGDTLRIEATGSNPVHIVCYHNGKPIITYDDSTVRLSGSYVGFMGWSNVHMDDWSGGELSGVVAGGTATVETFALSRMLITVKPSGQGGDFSSISAALAHVEQSHSNLVSQHIYVDIEVSGDWSSPDPNPVNFNGNNVTTDAAHYINVYVVPASRHKGKRPVAGEYRMVGDFGGGIGVNYTGLISYVTIDGLAISYTGGAPDGILATNGGGGSLVVKNTIIYDSTGSNGWAKGFTPYSHTGSMTFINCIAIGNASDGFYIGGGAPSVSFLNCTSVANGGYGFTSARGDAVIKNCYGGGNSSSDMNIANGTFSNNYSEDGTGGSTTCAYSSSTGAKFVSVAVGAEDVHLLDGSSLIGSGAHLDGQFTTDVDGETRTSWDVGADEWRATYASAGGFICGGSATVETQQSQGGVYDGSGGSIAGGAGDVGRIWQAVAAGGAIAGGAAGLSRDAAWSAAAGAIAGGAATVAISRTTSHSASGGAVGGAGGRLASDDFNRADGDLGANWTHAHDSLAISGQKVVYNGGFGVSYWNGFMPGESQYVEFQCPNNVNNGGAVRIGASGHHWGAYVSAGNVLLWYYKDSSWGNPAGWAGTINASDVWRFEARGTNFKIYQNGTLRVDYTDTADRLPTGYVGLCAYSAGSSMDNWSGGDLAGGVSVAFGRAHTATAGALSGGTATASQASSYSASGGGISGGAGTASGSRAYAADGGAIAGGVATLATVRVAVAAGGAVAAGAADVTTQGQVKRKHSVAQKIVISTGSYSGTGTRSQATSSWVAQILVFAPAIGTKVGITKVFAGSGGAVAAGEVTAATAGSLIAVGAGGAVSGGQATVDIVQTQSVAVEAAGGSVAGSSAAWQASKTEIASGGAVCGGFADAATTGGYAWTSVGGAVCGSAALQAVCRVAVASGGSIAGATAAFAFARAADIAGGAVSGGVAEPLRSAAIASVGGCVAGGFFDVQVTGGYAWQALGGAVTGGAGTTLQLKGYAGTDGGVLGGSSPVAAVRLHGAEMGAVGAPSGLSSRASAHSSSGGPVGGGAADAQKLVVAYHQATGGGLAGGLPSTQKLGVALAVGGAVAGGVAEVLTSGGYAYSAVGGAIAGASPSVARVVAHQCAGGATAGGEATVSGSQGFIVQGTGGCVAGGQSGVECIRAAAALGGALAGGSAGWYSTGLSQHDATGGAIAGSSAVLQRIAVEAAIGGGVTGGLAALAALALKQATGGALGGGQGSQAKGFEATATGGGNAGGLATLNRSRAFEGAGGSIAAGLAAELRNVFAPMFGGGYAGGAGELVFIKVSAVPTAGGTAGGLAQFAFGRAIDIGGGSVSAGTAQIWRAVDIHPQAGGISAGLANIVAQIAVEILGGVVGGGDVFFELYSTTWARFIRTTVSIRLASARFTLKEPTATFELRLVRGTGDMASPEASFSIRTPSATGGLL